MTQPAQTPLFTPFQPGSTDANERSPTQAKEALTPLFRKDLSLYKTAMK